VAVVGLLVVEEVVGKRVGCHGHEEGKKRGENGEMNEVVKGLGLFYRIHKGILVIC